MSMWLATSDVLPTTRVEGRLGALRFRSVASQLPRNVWPGSGAVYRSSSQGNLCTGHSSQPADALFLRSETEQGTQNANKIRTFDRARIVPRLGGR